MLWTVDLNDMRLKSRFIFTFYTDSNIVSSRGESRGSTAMEREIDLREINRKKRSVLDSLSVRVQRNVSSRWSLHTGRSFILQCVIMVQFFFFVRTIRLN